VLQGEVTLLLDRQDVILQTSETAILKGVHHAWINHSDRDCVLFISAHGGR
jgi:quercetin dioxygenase-like cupin family protein